MLQAGPYPWPLKQRIASRSGHLSNNDCKELLEKVIHSNLQGVTFAHLSETKTITPTLLRRSANKPWVASHVMSHLKAIPALLWLWNNERWIKGDT